MRCVACRILFVAIVVGPATVVAEDSAGRTPAPPANAQNENSAADPGCADIQPPVYIEDWARLAKFTKSDPLVSRQVDHWINRQQHVRWKLGPLFLLGGGLSLGSTLGRLSNDHWTNTTKWTMASGVGILAAALVAAWAILPDRNDFLGVVNQWNARNPDWPVVP